MKFRNKLEEDCFNICKSIFGDSVHLDHNKKIKIENRLLPQVASFSGPPSKEIDVIVIELISGKKKVALLISCKDFKKRAEPAHIQEWCSVVETMNKYSDGTLYLGLVVAPNGFTSGCEAWAASNNIGIAPPIKGISIEFSYETVLLMFQRLIIGISKRIKIKYEDLLNPSDFFDFVFSLICDFEGREDYVKDSRYVLQPENWITDFGDLYKKIEQKVISDIGTHVDCSVVLFSDDTALICKSDKIYFSKKYLSTIASQYPSLCSKNFEAETCSLDFIKQCVVGKKISSAADFGDYFEVGVDSAFNLAILTTGFHIVSTKNPPGINNL